MKAMANKCLAFGFGRVVADRQGHSHWFGISLDTAGGTCLLQLPRSANCEGRFPQAVVHASWRGGGHALTQLTQDEHALSLAHAFSWLQQN